MEKTAKQCADELGGIDFVMFVSGFPYFTGIVPENQDLRVRVLTDVM